MSIGKFVLQGKRVVPCEDLMVWAMWMEEEDKRVAADQVGDTRVSTVFLGLDMAMFTSQPPLLFETMVFTDDMCAVVSRDSTWEEAEARHKHTVEQLRTGKGRLHAG